MFKKTLLALCFALLLQSATSQTSWKASDYKPEPYRKVMVYAKVSDFIARRQLEDYTVQFLNDKGIVSIPAYSNIDAEKVTTRESFLAKADSLQVDALIVYEVNGAEKRAESTPSVSVGVGVGMYGGYAGASVPITSNAKIVTDVKLTVYFYNRASKDEQWARDAAGTLDGPTDKLAFTLAKNTVKALVKDGMFVTKK